MAKAKTARNEEPSTLDALHSDGDEHEFVEGEEPEAPEYNGPTSFNTAGSLLVLRGLAHLFAAVTTQHANAKITILNGLADAIESGQNVDREMRKVAQALKTGELKDWDAVAKSINENSRLLNLPAASGNAPPAGAAAPAPIGKPPGPDSGSGPRSTPPVATDEDVARVTGSATPLTAGAGPVGGLPKDDEEDKEGTDEDDDK
jgi:hypothetical protein